MPRGGKNSKRQANQKNLVAYRILRSETNESIYVRVEGQAERHPRSRLLKHHKKTSENLTPSHSRNVLFVMISLTAGVFQRLFPRHIGYHRQYQLRFKRVDQIGRALYKSTARSADDTLISDQPRSRTPKRKKLSPCVEEKPSISPQKEERLSSANQSGFFDQWKTYVSCHPGLEGVLYQELDQLGIAHSQIKNGAVLSPTSVNDILRCCLFLGSATQVYVRWGTPILTRGLEELERKVALVPWTGILGKDVGVKTIVKISASRLFRAKPIRECIERAIYAVTGVDSSQNDDGTSKPIVHLLAELVRDQLEISIKSSPTPLHERKYRPTGGKPQIREDLAYSLLWIGGLRPSYWNDHPPCDTFLDPFCKYGTVAIEAAAMLFGLPPGRLHQVPFQGTSFVNNDQWKALLQSTTTQQMQQSESHGVRVYASERNSRVMKDAIANAQRAGLADKIEFQDCAFSLHHCLQSPTTKRLFLVFNLPYGLSVAAMRRTSHHRHPFRNKYRRLARFLRRRARKYGCQYTSVLLTDTPSLVRQSGFEGDMNPVFKTRHGNIVVSGIVVSSKKIDK